MMCIGFIKNKIQPFYILKLASSFGVQLVSLFLIYLFTPEEYGQLALIITVAQLLYIMTTGWTDPTIVNLGTREFIEKGSYKNIVYYRSIIVSCCLLLMTILFLVFKDIIVELIHSEDYYWVTYLLFLAFSLRSMFNQMLYPSKKNLLQSSLDFGLTIFLIILSFILVRTVKDYIYVQFALYVGYAIIVIMLFSHFFGKDRFVFEKKDFIKTLRFSVWQILGVLGIYLTNLGVNYVYTIENVPVADIGLYNVAYKLFSEFTPIFAICVIVIPQWIYGTKDKNKLVKDINKKTIWGVFLLSLAYLAVFCILEPFLLLIGKTDYIPSVSYYLWLFPAFVFMVYCQIMHLIIMTTPDFKHIQYATIIQGFVLMVSCFVLVYFWGIAGAVASVTLANIGKSIYLYLIYKTSSKYMILTDENYE